MDARAVHRALDRGYQALTEILGRPPSCSAAPGWRCNELVLQQREAFPFTYNSDCRGNSVFLPVVGEQLLAQPQVPTTLPTYDEVIGTGNVTRETYNRHLLSLLRPEALNVLTVHAEVEGGCCLGLFDEFLGAAREQGAVFVPLRELVGDVAGLPRGRIRWGELPGREGRLAIQEKAA
jgi:undecaprenyl phosphate-alpha-L-ara4FN deformylase